jgi:hypothetical protein
VFFKNRRARQAQFSGATHQGAAIYKPPFGFVAGL